MIAATMAETRTVPPGIRGGEVHRHPGHYKCASAVRALTICEAWARAAPIALEALGEIRSRDGR